MATIAELKAQTQALIEARSAWLIDVAKTILAHPEAGIAVFDRVGLDVAAKADGFSNE